MCAYIKRLEAYGIHGRFDLQIDFLPDINVIYGKNGTGKTTMLHILANVLNGSFERFAFLDFKQINVLTGDNRVIQIRKSESEPPDDEVISVYVNDEKLHRFNRRDVKKRVWRPSTPTSVDPDVEELEQSREFLKRLPVGGPAAYFPAFRTMFEALTAEDVVQRTPPAHRTSAYFRNDRSGRDWKLTHYARKWFGHFVPDIKYSSSAEIEEHLSVRLRTAALAVADENKGILTQVFLDVFAALSHTGSKTTETPEMILDEISALLEDLERSDFEEPDTKHQDVYRRLHTAIPALKTEGDTAASVLSVYRKSLSRRIQIQREIFAPLERYRDSVNEFLEGKQLKLEVANIRRSERPVSLEFANGARISLRALSSGERQILSMLYATTYFSQTGNVVLIDEPEISLHIDWQRLLLPKMAQQLGQRQVIVCTHSVEIGADYFHTIQNLNPLPTDSSSGDSNPRGGQE